MNVFRLHLEVRLLSVNFYYMIIHSFYNFSQTSTWRVWGVITAKIKFGILLCCFPIRLLIFLVVFLMFSMMFVKTSLLFCCFCIWLLQTSMLLFVSIWCYSKPWCYYSCSYAVMQKLDAIIHVCMLLCQTSMLLFVFRIMFRKLDHYGLARVIN